MHVISVITLSTSSGLTLSEWACLYTQTLLIYWKVQDCTKLGIFCTRILLHKCENLAYRSCHSTNVRSIHEHISIPNGLIITVQK